MCLRALLGDVPVWLVTGQNVQVSARLRPGVFPDERVRRVLGAAHARDSL